MKQLISSSFLLLCILGSASCVRDTPQPDEHEYYYTEGRKVYMIHEGNYGSGNASLSIYNSSQDLLFNDVYQSVNNEEMGDVFQSMTIVENNLFFTINHSDLLLICSKNTMEKVNEINVSTPRYLLPLNERSMLLSSLYQRYITIISPQEQTITGTIDLPHTSVEGMLLHNGKIYLCPWDTACSVVLVMDAFSLQIVDSIDIGARAPHKIFVDKDNHLWVLYGNIQQDATYGWVQIQTENKSILKRFDYENGLNEWIKPVMNATKDELYWIQVDYSVSAGGTQNGVYRMSVDADIIPERAFIPAPEFHYFYGLGLDEITGNIYVGDPFSFIEQSKVYIYTPDGIPLKEINTQMGIGDFYFGD